MSWLGRLITGGARGAYRSGRAGRRYNPFSEPPYRGGYPFSRTPRGTSATTNDYYLASQANQNYSLRASRNQPLYLYEDRRQWHPLGANAFPKSKRQAYPLLTDKTPLRIWPHDPYTPYHPDLDPFRRNPIRTPYRGPLKTPRGHDYYKALDQKNLNITRSSPLSWENPYDMIICLKRKIRREMMHALGLAGKAGQFRKPVYTQFSFVRCR